MRCREPRSTPCPSVRSAGDRRHPRGCRSLGDQLRRGVEECPSRLARHVFRSPSSSCSLPTASGCDIGPVDPARNPDPRLQGRWCAHPSRPLHWSNGVAKGPLGVDPPSSGVPEIRTPAHALTLGKSLPRLAPALRVVAVDRPISSQAPDRGVTGRFGRLPHLQGPHLRSGHQLAGKPNEAERTGQGVKVRRCDASRVRRNDVRRRSLGGRDRGAAGMAHIPSRRAARCRLDTAPASARARRPSWAGRSVSATPPRPRR